MNPGTGSPASSSADPPCPTRAVGVATRRGGTGGSSATGCRTDSQRATRSRGRPPHRRARARLPPAARACPRVRRGSAIRNAATGTVRMRSTVRRPHRIGTSVGTRSTTVASSAHTGPPCWCSGFHGPWVSSVATYSSPRRTKSARFVVSWRKTGSAHRVPRKPRARLRSAHAVPAGRRRAPPGGRRTGNVDPARRRQLGDAPVACHPSRVAAPLVAVPSGGVCSATH